MKGILAILMAGIMMATMVAPVMGGDAGTGANVNNVDSTYTCSASISPQPNPTSSTDGTVSYSLVVTDNNGDDTIPDAAWTAEVNFDGTSQSDSLTPDTVNGDLQRTCTGSGAVPADTPAGEYTVTFKLNGTTTGCTATVSVTSVAAYAIDFSSVAYGGIDPDAASTVSGDTIMEPVGPAPDVKPTIENKGNVVMDVTMLIEDAVGNPEKLFESNTAATVGTTGPQTLTTTAAMFDVNIAVGGTANIDSTLSVPTGIQAAGYTGTLTVAGITSV